MARKNKVVRISHFDCGGFTFAQVSYGMRAGTCAGSSLSDAVKHAVAIFRERRVK